MKFDESKAVAIIGFFDGSAGQIETWFENVTGLDIVCFVIDSDDFTEVDIADENAKRVCQTTAFPQNGQLKNRPLVIGADWVTKLKEMGVKKVISLEPDNKRRKLQLDMAREHGFELVSAIHPTVLILPEAKISEGVWINASAIIGYKAEIGAGTIINTGVQIDHHNILEECCQVDPGVTTAGNVALGECCHIHTGATIINRIIIGSHAIVGAGSVVIKDIDASTKVVGVPSRVIETNL